MSASAIIIDRAANRAFAPQAPSRNHSLSATIATHAPLVRRLARSVHASVSGVVEVDDLVQVGLAALVEAAGTYVDRGDARFSTYAGIRIRGAMIDETRKRATLSRRTLRQRRNFAALRGRLHTQMGRAPTTAELAHAAGMSMSDYADALSAQQGATFGSLDDAYSDSNPHFADPAPDAVSQLESCMSAKDLANAIRTLPDRQQQVLHLFFIEGLSLIAIGEMLGVCSARICQIKKAALEGLRCKMAGWA